MADTITMDRAGRVVIPAAVRRELALVAGCEIELSIDDGAIILRPAASARLTRRRGRLVVASPLVGAVPDHRELRQEHLDRVGGPTR